jgi:hypothetical protein
MVVVSMILVGQHITCILVPIWEPNIARRIHVSMTMKELFLKTFPQLVVRLGLNVETIQYPLNGTQAEPCNSVRLGFSYMYTLASELRCLDPSAPGFRLQKDTQVPTLHMIWRADQ